MKCSHFMSCSDHAQTTLQKQFRLNLGSCCQRQNGFEIHESHQVDSDEEDLLDIAIVPVVEISSRIQVLECIQAQPSCCHG